MRNTIELNLCISKKSDEYKECQQKLNKLNNR